MEKPVKEAKEKFEKIILEQLDRVERIKVKADWIDYVSTKPIIIGLCRGDGIGTCPDFSSQTHL